MLGPSTLSLDVDFVNVLVSLLKRPKVPVDGLLQDRRFARVFGAADDHFGNFHLVITADQTLGSHSSTGHGSAWTWNAWSDLGRTDFDTNERLFLF